MEGVAKALSYRVFLHRAKCHTREAPTPQLVGWDRRAVREFHTFGRQNGITCKDNADGVAISPWKVSGIYSEGKITTMNLTSDNPTKNPNVGIGEPKTITLRGSLRK